MSEAPVAIIGAGPAGLFAAELLSAAGKRIVVYERMPSVARKFLMAGRGGLNLTHSEDFGKFLARYGNQAAKLKPIIEAFTPNDLVAWANGLGVETFVGSSGRVFPKAMKASPLLRAWLARLSAQGVEIQTRSTWLGWNDDGSLRFDTAPSVNASATLLALGGADHFRERFAGQPLKGVEVKHYSRHSRGEVMITKYGVEGGPIYALSRYLRETSPTIIRIDLRPDLRYPEVEAKLAKAKPGDTLSSTLRKTLGLSPIAIGLLHESANGPPRRDPKGLTADLKAIHLNIGGPHGLDRAISTAGGVSWGAVDETLQLRAIPNTYVAGEMLDWEAPTGGYLLQACFATGAWAARAILRR